MRCKICRAGTPGQKHGQWECGCLQAAMTTVPHVCHQECAGALPGQMRVGGGHRRGQKNVYSVEMGVCHLCDGRRRLALGR